MNQFDHQESLKKTDVYDEAQEVYDTQSHSQLTTAKVLRLDLLMHISSSLIRCNPTLDYRSYTSHFQCRLPILFRLSPYLICGRPLFSIHGPHCLIMLFRLLSFCFTLWLEKLLVFMAVNQLIDKMYIYQ